jgi:hopanoid biosynthesis associated protein HpnK
LAWTSALDGERKDLPGPAQDPEAATISPAVVPQGLAAGGQPAPCVIFNADDFGRSSEVNAAVALAHRNGVLTSASLMVTGEAFEEAVLLAHKMPSLAMGLHLVLVDGRASLAPNDVPHLVDGEGRFSSDPVRAGIYYFFSPAARRELRREIEAQLERFVATGLPLSHVDGHLQMHLHPAVFGPLVAIAEKHGSPRVRLPRDDLLLSLRNDRRRPARKLFWSIVFGLLCRRCGRLLCGRGLGATRRAYGLMQSGAMTEAYVSDLLCRLSEPSAEVCFHPTTGATMDPLGPNPGDLSTLLSPAIRSVIGQRGLRLAGWLS